MTKILIVDDRQVNREYLVTLLNAKGFTTLEAVDGKDALQKIKIENFHLIISDILMPNMDGFAMVREIRNNPLMPSTPVIFYTAAYLEQQAINLAHSCGVEHILTKPLEPQEVLRVVDLVLNQGNQIPSPITNNFNTEHLHLLVNKLYEKVNELENSNSELKKLSEELAEANALLQNLSLTDQLTSLYNRRGFLELAPQQLKLLQRTQNQFCLVYMDIDNLKIINDQFGHSVGDDALIQFSKILRRTFRTSDIIARIGGDEFIVLVIDVPDESIDRVQERLQKNLDKFNTDLHPPYHLSVSIGIHWVDLTNQLTIEALIAQADAEMYVNKQAKKGKMPQQKT